MSAQRGVQAVAGALAGAGAGVFCAYCLGLVGGVLGIGVRRGHQLLTEEAAGPEGQGDPELAVPHVPMSAAEDSGWARMNPAATRSQSRCRLTGPA